MSAAVQVSDRKRMFIFINIVIACFATSLLITALNTAIAPISKDLHVNDTAGQWMTSGYSLAMGIVMPLTAFLMRKFLTKRLYLIGLIIFLVGIVVDLVAPNFGILMVGRVLQGCGNGILISMSQVIILTIFPPEKTGSIMGWYGLATSVAPVIAPTLGGVLVDTVSWRAIFALVLVIVAVTFVMAIFVFDNVLETVETHIDILSFILSVLAFGGITLGVGNAASYGIRHPMIIAALVIGVVAFILFVRRQFGMDEPFLNLRVLKVRDYSVALTGTMLLYFVMMGSSVIMPLYVETITGHSAAVSGLVTLPGSIAMAVISPLAGRLYDRMGIKNLFLVAPVFMFVGSIGMFFITLHMPLPVAALYNALICVCIGGLQMPLVTWGNSSVGSKLLSDATALLASLRTIAGAIGSAVLVGTMDMIAARSASGGTPSHADSLRGMHTSFLYMAIITVVLFFVGVFLVRRRRK